MQQRYPLQWPATRSRTPSEQRKVAQFGTFRKQDSQNWQSRKKLSISEACDRIITELDKYTPVGKNYRVDPDTVIISTNLKYKRDGMPYSNQKDPEDVGVAVYFTLDGKPYCLPCDKWVRIADNLAAVAAHIGAMRSIERWGVGESADLYAGYMALPAPGQSTVITCWEILGISSTKDVDAINKAYNAKARAAHPDLGGDHAQMLEVNAARVQALQYANQ